MNELHAEKPSSEDYDDFDEFYDQEREEDD